MKDAGAGGNMQARAGAARRSLQMQLYRASRLNAPLLGLGWVQPPDCLTEVKPTVGGAALDGPTEGTANAQSAISPASTQSRRQTQPSKAWLGSGAGNRKPGLGKWETGPFSLHDPA